MNYVKRIVSLNGIPDRFFLPLPVHWLFTYRIIPAAAVRNSVTGNASQTQFNPA